MTECPICYETVVNELCLTNCSHSFCKSCITEWVKFNSVCPVCRANTNVRDFISNESYSAHVMQYYFNDLNKHKMDYLVSVIQGVFPQLSITDGYTNLEFYQIKQAIDFDYRAKCIFEEVFVNFKPRVIHCCQLAHFIIL
uniref:RING-type domain-containing protein n=1 Tax=viral metagenome TaxID=1070528 RepID=A0A6C0IAC7_9ZZZZ